MLGSSILQFSCDVYKSLFPLPQPAVNTQARLSAAELRFGGRFQQCAPSPVVIRLSGKALDPHGGQRGSAQDPPSGPAAPPAEPWWLGDVPSCRPGSISGRTRVPLLRAGVEPGPSKPQPGAGPCSGQQAGTGHGKPDFTETEALLGLVGPCVRVSVRVSVHVCVHVPTHQCPQGMDSAPASVHRTSIFLCFCACTRSWCVCRCVPVCSCCVCACVRSSIFLWCPEGKVTTGRWLGLAGCQEALQGAGAGETAQGPFVQNECQTSNTAPREMVPTPDPVLRAKMEWGPGAMTGSNKAPLCAWGSCGHTRSRVDRLSGHPALLLVTSESEGPRHARPCPWAHSGAVTLAAGTGHSLRRGAFPGQDGHRYDHFRSLLRAARMIRSGCFKLALVEAKPQGLQTRLDLFSPTASRRSGHSEDVALPLPYTCRPPAAPRVSPPQLPARPWAALGPSEPLAPRGGVELASPLPHEDICPRVPRCLLAAEKPAGRESSGAQAHIGRGGTGQGGTCRGGGHTDRAKSGAWLHTG